MPSVANTQFSRKFRNHLTTNTLPLRELIQRPKIHLPHCETCLTSPRNMPDRGSKDGQSQLERCLTANWEVGFWSHISQNPRFRALFHAKSSTNFFTKKQDKRLCVLQPSVHPSPMVQRSAHNLLRLNNGSYLPEQVWPQTMFRALIAHYCCSPIFSHAECFYI